MVAGNLASRRQLHFTGIFRQHCLCLIDSFSTFVPWLLPYSTYPHAMRLSIVSFTTIALVSLLSLGCFAQFGGLPYCAVGFSPRLCHKQFYADDFFEGRSRFECLGSYWMSYSGLPMHMWQSDLHRLARARFQGRL